jgi:hypothetical protein
MLLLIALLLLTSCICFPLIKVFRFLFYGVDGKQHRIVFLWGNNVPPEAWAEIDAKVLSKPDYQDLYKLRSFERGRRTGKDLGNLCDMFLVTEVRYGNESSGFSGRVIQIGAATAAGDDKEDKIISGHPHVAYAIRTSEQMVKETAQILKKYGQKRGGQAAATVSAESSQMTTFSAGSSGASPTPTPQPSASPTDGSHPHTASSIRTTPEIMKEIASIAQKYESKKEPVPASPHGG